MSCRCTNIRRVDEVEQLPDGVYNGVWGGSLVRFTVNGQDYEAKAEHSIRTPRAPCKVISKGGSLFVEIYREVPPTERREPPPF